MPPPRGGPDSSPPTSTLTLLSYFKPPSTSRTWQSAPHPALPILATACSDRTVRIYSLTSFTLLTTISGGHKRSVRALSWKPGSATGSRKESVLATGSFDASAGIWRKYEDSVERDFTRRRGEDEESDEEEEEDDYQFSSILDGHDSEIKSLAWSASGQFLATCSRDKSVWIWEELEDDNFETVAVLQEHEADVKCVAWHPEEDLLASASYDDTVRLYKEDVDDWGQVTCLEGHSKTVWWVEFEGAGLPALKKLSSPPSSSSAESSSLSPEQKALLDSRHMSGPRLVSCSDDCTIRIWSRTPKETPQTSITATGIPSILRSQTIDEEWIQEAILPQNHDRAIYSVSWSRKTGMIVSAGSDGRIIVYKERWKSGVPNGVKSPDAMEGVVNGTSEAADTEMKDSNGSLTEWVVVAELDGAHDVYEINHVCWARRCDKGKRDEDEEIIVTTGDDGEVKAFILEDFTGRT